MKYEDSMNLTRKKISTWKVIQGLIYIVAANSFLLLLFNLKIIFLIVAFAVTITGWYSIIKTTKYQKRLDYYISIRPKSL